MEEKKEIKVSINVMYLYCNNVHEIRHFYKEILGMGEMDFGMPDNVFCGMTADKMSMMWFKTEKDALPKKEKWVDLPGFEGGEVEEASWGIQLPTDIFPDIVKKLKEEGVQLLFPNPIWCQDSYWAFPVRDPMGYTVEVYAVPKEKPEDKVWQE